MAKTNVHHITLTHKTKPYNIKKCIVNFPKKRKNNKDRDEITFAFTPKS